MTDFNEFKDDFIDQLIVNEPIDIQPETVFRNLDAWDSLTGMAIIAMIEDKYKVKITDSDFKNFKTVGDIYGFVRSKSNEESKD